MIIYIYIIIIKRENEGVEWEEGRIREEDNFFMKKKRRGKLMKYVRKKTERAQDNKRRETITGRSERQRQTDRQKQRVLYCPHR